MNQNRADLVISSKHTTLWFCCQQYHPPRRLSPPQTPNCPETFENTFFVECRGGGPHPHARPHYRSNHAVQHPRGTALLLYRSPAIAAPGTASRHSVAERLQTVCPRRTTASPHALCTFSRFLDIQLARSTLCRNAAPVSARNTV